MITLNELKTALNIKQDNATHDVFLNRIRESIKEQIESWCGQNIVAKQHTYYFNGDGTSEILLKKNPVIEIVTLKYRESPMDSWELIPSTDYEKIENDGLEYLYYSGYYTNKYYELVFKSGYEFIEQVGAPGDLDYVAPIDQIPIEVKQVALEMGIWIWTESQYSDSKSLTIQSKSISEAGSTINLSFMKDWKKDWRRTLGKYRMYLL